MKKIILIGIAVVAIGALVGYKLYNKPHRSIEDETAIVLNANVLFSEYEKNEAEANAKYLDKVIEVTGTVSETLKNQDNRVVVILSTDDIMYGINCTMENETEKITVGSVVTIKGICTGYLSDVVITRGLLAKK